MKSSFAAPSPAKGAQISLRVSGTWPRMRADRRRKKRSATRTEGRQLTRVQVPVSPLPLFLRRLQHSNDRIVVPVNLFSDNLGTCDEVALCLGRENLDDHALCGFVVQILPAHLQHAPHHEPSVVASAELRCS